MRDDHSTREWHLDGHDAIVDKLGDVWAALNDGRLTAVAGRLVVDEADVVRYGDTAPFLIVVAYVPQPAHVDRASVTLAHAGDTIG